MKMKMGLGSKLDRRKNGKKGFTLVELIVVIVIILILAAVAVPLLMNYIGQAKEAKRMSELSTFQTVAAAQTAEYMVDPGGLPSDWRDQENNNQQAGKKFSFIKQLDKSYHFDCNFYSTITYGEPGTSHEYDIIKIQFIYQDDQYNPEATYIYTSEAGWKRDDNFDWALVSDNNTIIYSPFYLGLT
ncbi:MAG: prepilin-type N-terminal cleavage/methylation domain-containing protein [Oscillospiraceae bacterium]|nr:prepilin-type N-terminal cleavage/methylation domain-containing protein [Oscillospiraceae bacterium]